MNTQIVVNNKDIEITGYTASFKQQLVELLTYTDKSKQYQIRKMSKNPYSRNTDLYRKLKESVSGCLLREEGNTLYLPSGFAYLFKDSSFIDNRKDTGTKIALPWQNKPFSLRDYQQEAVDLMSNSRRGLINAATALGKTLTAIYAVRTIGRKTLILCPNKSIARNFYKELCSCFGDNRVGMFGDGKHKLRDITVGIAQSVVRHIDKVAKHELGLIIIDEAHRTPADTFFNITTALGDVGRIFGMTATDFRSDGKDIMITAGVGEVILKRDIVWGIENQWLAYPHIIMRSVPTEGRDFKDDKLKNYKMHVLNSDILNNQIISDINKCIASGKAVLVLVDEKAHGRYLAEKTGLALAVGDDKDALKYVDDLNSHKIQGLIGTDSLIGEGCDTKNVDVLILANFVASKGPLWQNLGRGMRRQGKKRSVLILDYKPCGSSQLERHADQRLKLYKSIPCNLMEA